MKSVIMAGGRGERVRPFSDKTPKPMLRVGDKPILEYVVGLLRKYGVNHIIMTVCYLAEDIVKYFGSGEKFGVDISYVREESDRPLGTAGAVSLARDRLQDTFIVCAADILRELNIERMLEFHKEKRPIATLSVYKNINPDPKSNIHFNSNNKITLFEERPKNVSNTPVWSNASFYIFEPEIFSFIPDNVYSDFGKDVFPAVLRINRSMYVYTHKGYFLDIGTIAKLQKARVDIPKRKFYVTHKRH